MSFYHNQKSNTYKLLKRNEITSTHPNLVDDSIKCIYCYKLKSQIFVKMLILNIFLLGIPQILGYFNLNVFLYLYCKESLSTDCDYFVVIDKNDNSHLVQSILIDINIPNKHLRVTYDELNEKKELYLKTYNKPTFIDDGVPTDKSSLNKNILRNNSKINLLIYKQNRYSYDEESREMKPLTFDLSYYKNKEIHEKFSKGIDNIFLYNLFLNKFGTNQIFMSHKSFLVIFFEQFTNIKYLYQVFMICVWYYFDHYIFSSIVFVLSIFIILVNTINIYFSNQKILQFALHEETSSIRGFDLNDYRLGASLNNKKSISKDSAFLVPGDIIEIETNDILSCDCVLLDGVCTVNEADLTGESSLIMKSSLPKNDKKFTYYDNQKSYLFHGTKVEKCESNNSNGKMIALVINTGLNTNRGNLIQNILFPKTGNQFKNSIDTIYYVLLMTLLYIIGIIICSVSYSQIYSINYFNSSIDKNTNNTYFDVETIKDIEYVIVEVKNFFDIEIDSKNFYDNFIYNNSTEKEIFLFVIFRMLLIILPPILPISSTFTSFFFQYNLRKKSINCVDDTKIPLSGQINTIVLDKTGTLTEEDLELYGFQSLSIAYRVDSPMDISEKYQTKNESAPFFLYFDDIELNSEILNIVLEDFYKKVLQSSPDDSFFQDYKINYKYNMIYFLECLASCHSIDILKGESFGNSVDKKIFENLKWIQVREPDDLLENIIYSVYPVNYYKISGNNLVNKQPLFSESSRYKLTIIKRFQFSSKFQSMSVIVKNNLDCSYRYFIKGAPEKIIQYCRPDSLPSEFDKQLLEHTKSGYRVLAAATKYLDINDTENMEELKKDDNRRKLENDLTFLGFIIFKNKLKKDTKHTINKMNKSNCKLIMATGDNPFTSISVSRECDFLEENAKVYLLDLEREGNIENIKITYLSSTMAFDENQEENNNNDLSDRTTSKLLGKSNKHNNQKEIKFTNNISIQTILRVIKETNDSILCISGKAFEHIISKYLEEKEDDDFLKNEALNDNSLVKQKRKVNSSIFKSEFSNNSSEDYKKASLSNNTYNNILSIIREKGKIFYRMSPNNKVLLVNFLKKDKNVIVAMCGDGANDCGALLAADIGISLCNKVGNNVTSHFYSKAGSISCIEIILRNGRACYENSIIVFKYMIIYSVIQIVSTIILYTIGEQFSQNQYLFFDFFICLICCILSSKTGPSYEVDKSILKLSIIDLKFLVGIIGHMLIESGFLYLTYVLMFKLNNTFIIDLRKEYINYDIHSYIFIVASYQFIFTLFLFNSSSKHRKSFYVNKLYMFYVTLIVFILTSMVTVEDFYLLKYTVNIVGIDDRIYNKNSKYLIEVKKIIVLVIVCINTIISFLYEFLVSKLIK